MIINITHFVFNPAYIAAHAILLLPLAVSILGIFRLTASSGIIGL